MQSSLIFPRLIISQLDTFAENFRLIYCLCFLCSIIEQVLEISDKKRAN